MLATSPATSSSQFLIHSRKNNNNNNKQHHRLAAEDISDSFGDASVDNSTTRDPFGFSSRWSSAHGTTAYMLLYRRVEPERNQMTGKPDNRGNCCRIVGCSHTHRSIDPNLTVYPPPPPRPHRTLLLRRAVDEVPEHVTTMLAEVEAEEAKSGFGGSRWTALGGSDSDDAGTGLIAGGSSSRYNRANYTAFGSSASSDTDDYGNGFMQVSSDTYSDSSDASPLDRVSIWRSGFAPADEMQFTAHYFYKHLHLSTVVKIKRTATLSDALWDAATQLRDKHMSKALKALKAAEAAAEDSAGDDGSESGGSGSGSGNGGGGGSDSASPSDREVGAADGVLDDSDDGDDDGNDDDGPKADPLSDGPPEPTVHQNASDVGGGDGAGSDGIASDVANSSGSGDGFAWTSGVPGAGASDFDNDPFSSAFVPSGATVTELTTFDDGTNPFADDFDPFAAGAVVIPIVEEPSSDDDDDDDEEAKAAKAAAKAAKAKRKADRAAKREAKRAAKKAEKEVRRARKRASKARAREEKADCPLWRRDDLSMAHLRARNYKSIDVKLDKVYGEDKYDATFASLEYSRIRHLAVEVCGIRLKFYFGVVDRVERGGCL